MAARIRGGVRWLGAGAMLSTAALSLASVAATAIAPAGCADKAGLPVAPPEIVIGVSLGLTKALGPLSLPLRNAVKAAEREINAAGGVLGRPLLFDVVDDQSSDDAFAQGVANDFVKRGVAAIIGPAGSGQVKAVQKIFFDAQMLEISPSATSTELTDIQPPDSHRRFLFRTTPADDFQGAAVLLLARQTPSALTEDAGAPDGGAPTCNRLAIVDIANSYGTSMGDLIASHFTGAGRVVIRPPPVAVTAVPSYKALAADLVAQSPECLALIAYDNVGAPFVRDFKADPGYAALAKRGFFFIGTDGLFTDGFIASGKVDPADPHSVNVVEGVYGTAPDTQPGTKEYNVFRTIYSSYFPLQAGEEAPAYTANVFDAAVLIALAIEQARSATNRVAMRDALLQVAGQAGGEPAAPYSPAQIGDALRAIRNGERIDYTGASGDLDIDAKGNVTGGFVVWQAQRDAAGVSFRTVAHLPAKQLERALQ